MSLIYKGLATLAIALAIAYAGYQKGYYKAAAVMQEAITKQALEVAKLRNDLLTKSEQVVTKYIDRVKIVKEQGDEVVKKVVEYRDGGGNCPDVPYAVGLLINAAISGADLPSAASVANAPPIAFEAFTTASIGNVEIAKKNAEQLTALQAWARAVSSSSSSSSSSSTK